MVKTGTEKEVASDSGTPKAKSKKSKRKSTFYSFPVNADFEVFEESPKPVPTSVPTPVPTLVPTPVPLKAEEKGPENENDGDIIDIVDSVDNYDINFQIKTRKSESHWYMIYYDGSIDITDDEDYDDVDESCNITESALRPAAGCTASNAMMRDHRKNKMVCVVICF